MLRIPHPVLAERSSPLAEIDRFALELAEDLVDTMYASPNCVGLAAPQIGVSRRALVMDVSSHRKAGANHGLVVLFDPVLVEQGELVVAREGCMSVPDLTGDVGRPNAVVVEGLGADSLKEVIEAEGFEARALMHELDHLDGLVFLDRVGGPHAIHARRVYR